MLTHLVSLMSLILESGSSDGMQVTYSLLIPQSMLRDLGSLNNNSNDSELLRVGQVSFAMETRTTLNPESTLPADSIEALPSTLTGPTLADPSSEQVIGSVGESACAKLCDSIDSCSNTSQGSYCKLANSPHTCFALYWKVDSTGTKIVCYTGDSDCPETDPVICEPEPSVSV
jgi:hypothetical protein